MKKLDRQKRVAVIFAFTLILTIITTSPIILSNDNLAYNFVRRSVRDFNSVAEDSNIDGSANIGTNDSSYINTQSYDGTQQNITEASTVPDYEVPYTNISNSHPPHAFEDNISVDNWGFETGDDTDWSVTETCDAFNGVAAEQPHEGTYAYKCATGQPNVYLELYIRYNITDFAVDIINGSIQVNASIWGYGHTTGGTDSTMQIGARLYDSGQTYIKTLSSDLFVTTGGYVFYTFSEEITEDTRYYEFYTRYTRGLSSPTGLGKNGYFDDHYIEVQTSYGTYSYHYSMNLDDNIYNTLTETLESGAAGWYEENDVDNNAADMDGSADIGTETSFGDAQGTTLDSTYMNIQEGNGDTYAAGNNVEDYLDNVTDTQTPVDCGFYDDWTNMQLVDGTDTTLSECNGAGYIAPNYIEDFLDNVTDTDSGTNPDIGTYSDWTEMQDFDGVFNDAVEGYTGSLDNEWLIANGFDSTNTDCTATGASPYVDARDEPTNLIDCNTNNAVEGWFDYPSTAFTGSGFTVNITVFCNNDDGAGNDAFDIFVDVSGGAGTDEGRYCDVGTTYTEQSVPVDNACAAATCTATEINAMRIELHYFRSGGADNVRMDEMKIGVFRAVAGDYVFNRQVGFTGLDYDETSEFLCIRTGNIAGIESLQIRAWTGSAWSTIIDTISSSDDNTWINISISAYLTSPYLTFSFEDQIASDGTEDTWEIDSILIRVSSTEVFDYEFDREIGFTSVDFDEVNEELAIFTGTMGAESLQVYVWTGSWTLLVTLVDANDDTWINTSISAYLTTSYIQFSFRGATETGDTTNTTWGMDGILIHSWTTEVIDYEINFEYQWTTANATPTTNFLSINAQNVPATEDLNVHYWSGSWISLGTITTNNWLNVTPTGLATTYTIRFQGTSEVGDTTQDDWDIDLILISGEDADTRNYRFNREVQINGLDTGDTYDNFELVINTGSLNAENLDVEIWNQTEGDWDSLFTLTTTDDWTNTSLDQLYWTPDIDFRFVDTTQTSDNGDPSTWEIDYFGIHIWSAAVYMLDWEHQVQTIELDCSCFYYMFLYGNASEDMEVIFWNDAGNDWNAEGRFNITSTEQWYNLTVPSYAVRENITWKYEDVNRTNDDTADVLTIDYIQFFNYNATVSIVEDTYDIVAIPMASEYTPANENPITILIDSGVDYNLTLICTSCGSVTNGVAIYFDTDSDPAGSTLIPNPNPTAQVLYAFESYSTTSLPLYMFADQYDPKAVGFVSDAFQWVYIAIVFINFGLTV